MLMEDGRVALEPGFPEDVAKELEARGHNPERMPDSRLFGGAQLIYKLEDGYCAGSDHRKEGLAVGF